MAMKGDRARQALAILGGVDDALAGIGCDSSTDCCRFRVTGREPWLTAAEWELVVTEVGRLGRRLPRTNDDADGRCPFLDEGGRCLVYAARPLGCRSHFCERAHGGPPPHPSTFRDAARQLAALPGPHEARGDDGKPRPITSWLAGASSARPARRRWRG